MQIDLKRGLSVRLDGAPEQAISEQRDTERVAHVLKDYQGLQPKLRVSVGEYVALGQTLFVDRKQQDICFTAFCAGVVRDIRRDARKRIASITIERAGDERIAFPAHTVSSAARLTASDIKAILLSSGDWTSIRSRPFDRVASPDIIPRAIFVTAIDTRPLAPDPAMLLTANHEAFTAGLTAIATLSSGTTYVCTAPNTPIALPDIASVTQVAFGGPHPAGLPGTHLHALGLSLRRQADLWHIGYQDVLAIGELLLTGRVVSERVIAIAGPAAHKPRLIKTCLGADVTELTTLATDAPCRVVAGSPFDGTQQPEFLGRYDLQLTYLPAVSPTSGRTHSPITGLLDLLRGLRIRRAPTLHTHCWPSGMLPIEHFDQVWPFSTPPAALLRALLIGDTEQALRLGCLGLSEEDLALCTYVCPAKRHYGAALRRTLHAIEALG